MRVLAGTGLALVLLGWSAGCCQLTTCFEDRLGDFVDHVGLHEPTLDALYHPGLDPLRIGEPDWCQCRLNRLLCPRACACDECGSCRSACCHHDTTCADCPDEVPTGLEEIREDAAYGLSQRDTASDR